MSVAEAALHSDSASATEAIGAALGRALRQGDLVVLEGPLGAGKTCLVRGLVAGAGGDPAAVRSPTFVLHQPHRAKALTVHHIDLYRLGPGASVEVLDVDTLLLDGAVVVEWGGFADLTRHQPASVSIGACDGHDDHRVLRLGDGARVRLAAAWRTVQERVTAR